MAGEHHPLLVRQARMPRDPRQPAHVVVQFRHTANNFSHSIFRQYKYIEAIRHVASPRGQLLHPVWSHFIVNVFSQKKSRVRRGIGLNPPDSNFDNAFEALRGVLLLKSPAHIVIPVISRREGQPV